MALKDNPEVDNPWAVANAMNGAGIKPKSEAGTNLDPSALYRRWKFHSQKAECVSAGQLGAVQRKGVQESAAPRNTTKHFGELIRLREATSSATGDGGVEVVLISAGPGNQRDRNFYPVEALARSIGVFEGVKCFLDHPSITEEQDRPERSVRDQCGWFSGVRLAESGDAIVARLTYMATTAGAEAQKLVESELAYQKQYPNADKVLIGFSINAEGPSHREERDDGNTWNVVDGIENVMSVDLVTFPARGGKVLGFREASALLESKRWRGELDALLHEARKPITWRNRFARMLTGKKAA